jgi:hypothetical protein
MLVCWWAYTADPHPSTTATLPPGLLNETLNFYKVFLQKTISSIIYYCKNIIKLSIMKLEIISVLASDQYALTAVQQKINTWITTKLLIKYKTDIAGNHIVFQIALRKG